ncbi:hypothetical protein TFLX_06259 [Thermoflexales bacterium]|nr:hypothetical protein TFLX_06259 [Thermoflexales bacterium]
MKKSAYASLLSLVMLTVVMVSLTRYTVSAGQTRAIASSNIEMLNYLGGPVVADYIVGDYAYLTQGSVLAVVNVSNPAAPIVVGQTAPLSGQATAIYATAGYAYALVANQLVVVDVRNPAQPVVIHSIDVGYSKNVMQGAHNLIYILGEGHWAHPYWSVVHLTIVDISNPTLPQIIGSNYEISGQYANANGLFVAGTTVYLATGDLGLHIVDASNPQQIIELGSYSAYAQSVFVSGTVAYMGMGYYQPGLRLLNVGTPTTPTLMASMTDTIKEVVVAGNFAYATGYDSKLRLIDVSQPHAPVEVGMYDASFTINDLSVVNDRAYLILDWGQMYMLNIGNAPAVTKLGQYWPWSISGLEIDSSMAYMIDSGRLAVLDIHQPVTPIRVEIYPLLHNISLIKISDQVAYVVDAGKTLNLLDVTNPVTPVALGVYTSSIPARINSLAVESQTVYLAEWKTDLRILDVSNPVTPTEVSTYSLDAHDVVVANGVAYVLAGDGVHILDVHQPLTPTLVVSYPITTDDLWTWAGSVKVSENRLFVTTHRMYWCGWDNYCTGSTLTILDVSDPANPVAIGNYDSSQASISDLLVKDNLIYVANSSLGLKVLNVADPLHITEGASYPTTRVAQSVALTGQYVYVVDGGLYVLAQNLLTMTGQVANHYLSPMADVSLEADNGSTTMTGSDGRYLLTGLAWGTHVVTPTRAGYVFSPPTHTVTLPPSATAQDFMMLPAPVSMTLTPGGVGLILSYTDTQGLVSRLDFPPNSTATTVTIVLTPTLVSSLRGWAFAGHAFDLTVYQDDALQPTFTFSESVTVTIPYSPRDIALVTDPAQLELRQWMTDRWQAAGQGCSGSIRQALSTTQLSSIFSGTLCAAGRFALFGPTHEAFLPIISRNASFSTNQ